ncbi:MAG: ATP-grasp domain-containing protein [Candidatus Pacearchaeota archaeon]
MKKVVIGYILSGRGLGEDELICLRFAKKNNIELVLFNISEEIDEEKIKQKIKKCDIIYNATAEDFAIEFEKTIEELGKKVIDSSKAYYYSEDKWMFFLKCKEHKIPTPETILLLEDITTAKKELEKFNRWPVVLKRIYGCMGEFVEKADNLRESEKIIKKFWKKGNERLPIIAQELIKSPSYRVTIIGNKILQTAVKENRGWKATGVYEKRFKKFKIDKELEKLIMKISKVMGIKVCGIDFLKKDGKWFVLEVNSSPGFDFFNTERKKLNEELLKFLKKEAISNHR